jgi:uncharacterized phosphosugar-binding protein
MMKLRYTDVVLAHLPQLIDRNFLVIDEVVNSLFRKVRNGKYLMVAGSGHSALFAMELYHRAGGASFVLPVVEETTLPIFGPALAREAERKPESLLRAFSRVRPQSGEMLWISSQSGINPAIVQLALEAKSLGVETVAFTSRAHSAAVNSRHSSGKRLMDVCEHVIDVGGVVGDAVIPITGAAREVSVGPMSTLSSVFVAHAILAEVTSRLELEGVSCVYTSVNTPQGEQMNQSLELAASTRDDRLLKT